MRTVHIRPINRPKCATRSSHSHVGRYKFRVAIIKVGGGVLVGRIIPKFRREGGLPVGQGARSLTALFVCKSILFTPRLSSRLSTPASRLNSSLHAQKTSQIALFKWC